MNNVLNAFRLIANEEGISLAKLEKEIGASKGVISRAINNNTTINSKWVVSLAEKYPEYNCRWILTGKGTMKDENYSVNQKVDDLLAKAEQNIYNTINKPLEKSLESLKKLLLEDIEKEISATKKRIDFKKSNKT